jgi:hypothetical protein
MMFLQGAAAGLKCLKQRFGFYRTAALSARRLDDRALPGDTLVHFGKQPIGRFKMLPFVVPVFQPKRRPQNTECNVDHAAT